MTDKQKKYVKGKIKSSKETKTLKKISSDQQLHEAVIVIKNKKTKPLIVLEKEKKQIDPPNPTNSSKSEIKESKCPVYFEDYPFTDVEPKTFFQVIKEEVSTTAWIITVVVLLGLIALAVFL